MTDCLFCRIAAREIPSAVVYEDQEIFAFRDIAPQMPTHILIVPKVHLEGLDSLTEEHAALVGRIPVVAAKLAREHGLAERGYRLVVNWGPDAGQTVFHLHAHLLGGGPMKGAMA